MRAGAVVAERFEIAGAAGAGGMGTVYRARDRLDGGAVAVKVLHRVGPAELGKLAREAKALLDLRHPGIVRYVAHGTTPAGEAYLATEWIDGVGVDRRLAEGGLSPAESVELARRTAEALAAAHARGIVHRDVKPSNLLLRDGRIDRVVLLDFGIATLGAAAETQAGAVVGTPGYMAPEQARGDRAVDARADVFALGAVLYECLTGARAFPGEHAMAILARVLLDEPPRVADRCEVPAALDALVGRMLAKDPEARPRDAAEVAKALGELPAALGERRRPAAERSALATTEQRLLSVIALARRAATPGDGALADLVRAFGALWAPLADGSTIVTIAGQGTATDQAIRAARCALALQGATGAAPLALATGLADVSGAAPTGLVIDRAVALLDRTPPGQISLDDTTAGLAGGRFRIDRDGETARLRAERPGRGDGRELLGAPTPFIGRDRELDALLSAYEECASDSVARVVLVVGAPGAGKTRLWAELEARLAERDPGVVPWVARADPLAAGSPFALLAQAVLGAAGAKPGEPAEVRRDKLAALVGGRVPARDAERVTAFLAELVGAAAAEAQIPAVEAARRDPQVMGDQMRRAWEELVAGACEEAGRQERAVVLVLEDLHWGDLPSVQLVDAALRGSRDRPLFVLALARPEVHELFPRLWAERHPIELRLPELGRRACERLVRAVLGELPAARVDRLVDRAGGNPFFLEELVRAEAAGALSEAPDTVLAMVQSRLEALPPAGRRVLRAASVFGGVFWTDGVASLLGGAMEPQELDGWLDALVRGESIVRRGEERFPGRTAFGFRHALVREAAYAMLLPEDRALGHRLAAGWLEGAGEPDAVVLAEHLERGGEERRAALAWGRAAHQALEGNDLADVERRTARGVRCGATGETLAELLLLAARAHLWRGQSAEAETAGRQAMAHVPPGHAWWCAAAGEAAMAAGHLARWDDLEALSSALAAAPPEARRSPAYREAAARAATQLVHAARYAHADALLATLDDGPGGQDGGALAAEARVAFARALRAKLGGDAGAYVTGCRAAAELSARAGDLRYGCAQRVNTGYAEMELGLWRAAEGSLAQGVEQAEALGLALLRAAALHNLGLVVGRRGDVAQGVALEHEAARTFAELGNRRLEGAAHLYASRLLAEVDPAAAEREAERAVELLGTVPSMKPYALAARARARLSAGRVQDALVAAREAEAALAALGDATEGESFLRLVLAEALLAAADPGAAAAAADAARRVRARAARIADPEMRASFLANVEENRRALEQAGGLGLAD